MDSIKDILRRYPSISICQRCGQRFLPKHPQCPECLHFVFGVHENPCPNDIYLALSTEMIYLTRSLTQVVDDLEVLNYVNRV